ncbi:probable multispanning membrane protein [Rhynchosporium graminicola]|uniref:Transmembrane 9 superfamily member n=1 Tax=Rhynchosporium graminicola TaxID=2792576 RepID=A0A1E1LL83_9HELO|nr:probable multispanning membrane protein [Rhynchosporium commune]
MSADFRLRLWRCLLFLATLSVSQAFYIPGWSIKSYKDNEAIPLMVNKVYSDNTQLQYAYYDLPFVCPPTGSNHAGSSLLSGQTISLNIGEVLRGDRIAQSDIELVMGKDQECNFLCSKTVTRKDLKRAREMVKDGYVVEWIVDNLPGATSFVTVDKSKKYYAAGFKMGYKDISTVGKSRYYINNHFTIVMRYRKATGKDGERGGKVVVGFEVYTKSIGGQRNSCPADINNVEEPFELYLRPNTTKLAVQYPESSYHPPESALDMEDGATTEIPYSYSVYWREDDKIEWAHRWDLYFVNQEEGSRIHWLAIVNSLIISGALSVIVAMILARTIRTDIKSYKDAVAEDGKMRAKRLGCSRQTSGTRTPKMSEKSGGLLEQVGDTDNDADVSSDEETLEDVTGWKLLHGDVFRAPPYGYILAPLVGSGMQLVFMAVGLLILSSFGVLNPSFRGGFVSVGVGLFVSAGIFSGYFSGRVYKTFGGLNWRKNTIITATLFPGLLFALMFILNLFVWAQASSTAIPFGTLVGIVMLWLCIQLPLVYVGSWYGYVRTGAWEHPTKTTTLPRQVPARAWYIRSPQSILLAGLVPVDTHSPSQSPPRSIWKFAVIFIELLFVFQSIWQDKSGYYYVFGFLSIISLILIFTIAEVTIVTIYVSLCSEDYNWWWHSFFVGGGSAVWMWCYCVWYYCVKLHIEGFVSGLLFFVYSAMACVVYGLLTGTVGFLTAYAFRHKSRLSTDRSTDDVNDSLSNL